MNWSLIGLKPNQWRTSTGEIRPIHDMTTGHIRNCIHKLETKYSSTIRDRNSPGAKRYRFLKRELRRRAVTVSDSVSEVNKEKIWHE